MDPIIENNSSLTILDENILSTLCYYDVFNYPLKASEVYRFLGTNHTNVHAVQERLEELSTKELVFQLGEFYSLQNNNDNVIRREKGNAEAKKFLDVAYKKGRFIAAFPFVRGVLASGSLSKGYMDEKSDLDFFIITAPGRLWIARTLLVMYKRIFLFNSHKYFCVNYFIDADHLEIEEKNLFTATELATVIPISGKSLYLRLMETNAWLKIFFPNYQPRPVALADEINSGWLKRISERLISFLGGSRLEKYFKELTLRRWEKIYRAQYADSDFQVAFKTKDYASKNHPNHYQRKVEKLFKERLTHIDRKIRGRWSYE